MDSILSEDDYTALIAYRKEKKAGTLVSREALIKELLAMTFRIGYSNQAALVPEERGQRPCRKNS